MKVSNDKWVFAVFYAEKRNKNKWWTPAALPDHPLVEAHLPLTIILPGALGRLAVAGYTPFEMWKAAEELAGTASVDIKEDNVILVQDYMMVACQLKAPALLGGSQSKTPALNYKHLQLTKPSAELRR